MTAFPYSFIYFNAWNPHRFIYLKPEKGTPFEASLLKAIVIETPGAPPVT